MTLTVTTRLERPGQPPRITRQTMLRTIDRVLVVIDGTDSEWLFERNPVDHRRVSGSLIDHKASRILIHQESDLRLGQQLRGWMDILTLRFDTSALAALRATEETRTTNGITFARYTEPKPAARGIAEVWWSAALLLPERLTIRENAGSTTSTVDSFVSGVDETKLAAPAMRFPSYRVLDVTDAREGQ